mmetsp:Transcript_92597/g.299445  ORF Transcript_92597/g.299445 Transcript_92597/m.299445 type:complete len:201 (+) Transcript_92597:276-878(+)
MCLPPARRPRLPSMSSAPSSTGRRPARPRSRPSIASAWCRPAPQKPWDACWASAWSTWRALPLAGHLTLLWPRRATSRRHATSALLRVMISSIAATRCACRPTRRCCSLPPLSRLSPLWATLTAATAPTMPTMASPTARIGGRCTTLHRPCRCRCHLSTAWRRRASAGRRHVGPSPRQHRRRRPRRFGRRRVTSAGRGPS